ncbi:amidohydrolase family protein [Aquimarina sp. ERC-38]|uniref:amidohydrolase family protein n=1 Tax=Aquimarina sp. ERC-38 TaxID=2949996 RepID=UPI0022480987|nr:amidohydrolase family protein [Aquimarina sp. ERC-38]UZO79611.1 amidohydrolase family protein [Aquimarina sp. ERC-38]
MIRSYISIILLVLLSACKQTITCDLLITNADILDVASGTILENKSLVINSGKIEAIVDNSSNYNGLKNLDAENKLVTPSFIDTHIHPTDVFGDRNKAPLNLNKDARRRLSDAYLPCGTTTVLMLGQPENWLDKILTWQKHPTPEFVDVFTAGGAMISKENQEPYIAHSVLKNTEEAQSKIIEYHKSGIKHIKLYYRLNNPEFEVAYRTADSLGMEIYGHIGGFGLEHPKMSETLKLGLTNYEHLGIIPNNVLTEQSDWDKLDQQFEEHFGELNSESRVLEYLLEQFRFLDEFKKDELEKFIDKLSKNKVSISTTIHYLYQQFESTYFTEPMDMDLTDLQRRRCIENFKIFMKYVKLMHDKGIEIRIGTDMPDGGKATISELILLGSYGFSIEDVFKIASLNGAKAIGIDKHTGSLSKDKKANMIIWDKSPFDAVQNFTSEKTIIKDGKIYKY